MQGITNLGNMCVVRAKQVAYKYFLHTFKYWVLSKAVEY